MKLGLALGGGGARALASLGVMTILAERGIRPVGLSGTSMGALIAAYYGVHGETETLRRWFEARKVRDYFGFMTRPHGKPGLVGTTKLRAQVDAFLLGKTFAETCVPVRVVATDLRTGKQMVFSRGSLADAVMASMAIPGLFPPVKIDDQYYIDGGISNPVPADVIPGRHDLVVGTNFVVPPPKRLDAPTLTDTLTLALNNAMRLALERHTTKKCAIITPDKEPKPGILRFDQAKKYLALGEDAGRKIVHTWQRNGLL